MYILYGKDSGQGLTDIDQQNLCVSSGSFFAAHDEFLSVRFLLKIYEAELAFLDWRKMGILWIYLHERGSLETGLG